MGLTAPETGCGIGKGILSLCRLEGQHRLLNLFSPSKGIYSRVSQGHMQNRLRAQIKNIAKGDRKTGVGTSTGPGSRKVCMLIYRLVMKLWL